MVTGLSLDPRNQTPIVMLRDRRGARELHIHIGVIEASSIAFELEQVRLARPLSHDLLRNTVEALGGAVARVHIVSLREHRFAALLVLHQAGREIELDARPSDGVALALRARAPIFCDTDVLDRAAVAARAPSAQSPGKKPRGVVPVRRDAQAASQLRRKRLKPNVRIGSRSEPSFVTANMADGRCTMQLEHLRDEAFGKYKQ